MSIKLKRFLVTLFLLFCVSVPVIMALALNSKFDTTIISPFYAAGAGILFFVFGTMFIENFPKIIKKRAPGLTAKKLLLFAFFVSVWVNGMFIFQWYVKNHIPGYQDYSLDMTVGFFFGILISVMATMGVAAVINIRKRQEIELLGFTFIGSFSPDRKFSSTEDEKWFEQMIKEKVIYGLYMGFETWYFCYSTKTEIKEKAKKVINRMKVVEMPEMPALDDVNM